MRTLLPPLALSLFLVSCAGTKAIAFIAPDGETKVPLIVEVADTPTERATGLMERAALEDGHGMLFVFKEPLALQFWMKDTLIPLEVMYFDGQGTFVNAITMQPCTGDPCPKYPSAALAKYAVETKPGFRQQYGIGVGWRIDTEQAMKISTPE